MLGKWEVSGIGVQVGLTNDVAKAKWIKILIKFQTKKCQNTAVHTSTSDYVEPINIPTFILFVVYYWFIKMKWLDMYIEGGKLKLKRCIYSGNVETIQTYLQFWICGCW